MLQGWLAIWAGMGLGLAAGSGSGQQHVLLAGPAPSCQAEPYYQERAPAGTVSVRAFGAAGDGRQNDGPAIQQAIIYAQAHQLAAVYFPPGTYLIQPAKTGPGTLKLANGVGLRGAGRAKCILKLAGGHFNPPALFYQAWGEEPEISNILVAGLTFDGSLEEQHFDANYQYCHALSINNGHNLEVRNCTFRSWRGDGLLFGDTDEPTRDARITRNVRVHNNEFYAIYREGCMFCCTQGGVFHHNWVHGPGYLVGGVDIERHSANETVRQVAVYDNLFDFRQGLGPAERGGPRVHYRRAVTMGFFYAGYPQGAADGRSGGHQIHDNTIYQGQIDCYGHTDVTIARNRFINFFEDIAGVGFLTPHAILVADAHTTTGLTGVRVSDNAIWSQMNGGGIVFNNYTFSAAVCNTITGSQQAGIQLLNSSVSVLQNTITDVGTARTPAAGILVDGDCPRLVIAHNLIRSTRHGARNFTSYGVKLGSYNRSKIPPRISYNRAIGLARGVVGEYAEQPKYALLLANRYVTVPSRPATKK